MNTERFSMKEFKPLSLLDRKNRVDEKIFLIETERSTITSKINDVCAELSFLNNEIKGVRLEDKDYLERQKRQSNLLKEKMILDKNAITLKNECKKLYLERDKIETDLRKIPEDKIKKYLVELRDKYMAFASDTTRVSSMRAMASRFVEELQSLLKEIN